MSRTVSYVLYQLMVVYLHGCWSSRPPPAPGKLFSVKINCTRELFNIQMDVGRPFKGIIFAKDFLDECRTKGKQKRGRPRAWIHQGVNGKCIGFNHFQYL